MGKTIIYKPTHNRILTQEEIQMLDALEDRPVITDEDSPELTPAADAALKEARRRRPLKPVRQRMNRPGDGDTEELIPITIYLPAKTVARAAELDDDSEALMGRLLTDALRALDTRRL